MAKSERDWESENAADTLIRAEEIKRQPGLHKKAMVIGDKRKMAIENVTSAEEDGAAIRQKRRRV